MNIDRRKIELTKEFAPMLVKSSFAYKIWIGALLAIIAVGLYAFVLIDAEQNRPENQGDSTNWDLIVAFKDNAPPLTTTNTVIVQTEDSTRCTKARMVGQYAFHDNQ